MTHGAHPESESQDAVGAAEQLVSQAWTEQLRQAARDCDTAVRACLHLRATALSALRRAQTDGDPRLIAAAQADLDGAVHDLADAIASRDHVHRLLAESDDR